MDFRYTSEQEAFRVRLREWLERNKVEVFGDHGDPLAERDEDSEARWQRMLEWHRRLYEAGYVALHWSKEWGGGGAGLVEQAIYQDEVLRLGLPLYGANQLAIDRIGPTLIFLGNDEQRRRYLPKMLTGEEIWCQGYSEPGAGSDLAGLQTRAVLDGDEFVINGQKEEVTKPSSSEWNVILSGAQRSEESLYCPPCYEILRCAQNDSNRTIAK